MTKRWLIAFLFLILVAHDLHELVHTGVGRLLCGAWGPRDFNVWQLAPGCNTWVPTLMGPLLSWSLMWTGLWLTRSADQGRRWTGLALIFAPNPLGRLLPALLGGGDEGVVALALLGSTPPWPRILVIIAAVLIILPPLVAGWRALPERRRGWWFALLFANGLLARGVLAEPGLLGAPLLIEFSTLLSAVGFAFTWRGLRNGVAPG